MKIHFQTLKKKILNKKVMKWGMTLTMGVVLGVTFNHYWQSAISTVSEYGSKENSWENDGKLYKENLAVQVKNEMTDSQLDSSLAVAMSLQSIYNKIAKNAVKAVVSIQVVSEQSVGGGNGAGNPLEEWLRQFQFGGRAPNPEPRKVESFGSGFLINGEGYLLSNNHVVENSVEIKVFFQGDDNGYKAEIVGTDPDTDIALLKIVDFKGELPYLTLGDSDAVNVGDIVVAIGNPFGLDQTLTTGVISAKGRSGIIGNRLENFMQTDVAINQGNSGGPLIDLHGNVIGINSAILSRGGGSIGISFSIPINMAKDIVEQLKDNGKVERGWIGVSFTPLDRELAKELGIDASGVVVNKIVENSPAEKADIEPADILIAYNGKKIKDGRDLIIQVSQTPIGEKVKLTLIRDGKKVNTSVVIEKKNFNEMAASERPKRKQSEKSDEFYGMRVSPMMDAQLRSYNVELPFGVVVSELSPNSPYRQNGGVEGDIILSINQQQTRTINQFEQVMKEIKPGEKFVVKFQRADSVFYLVFKS